MKTIKRKPLKERDERKASKPQDPKTNDIIVKHITYIDTGNCLHDEIIRGPIDKVDFYIKLIDRLFKLSQVK